MRSYLVAAILLHCCVLVAAPLPPLPSHIPSRTNNVPDDSNRVILVKFRAALPANREALEQIHKLTPVGKRLGWHQHVVPPGQDKHETIKRFKDSGLFEHVIEPRTYKTQETTPNDPLFPQLWGLTNIQAHVAWDTIRDASSVVVAVVDTGIDFSHPDLAANLWTGPSGEHGYVATNGTVLPGGLDDYGHGTHVAGTIGAVGNNGVGVVGIAWKAKIMAMKVLHGGSGNSIDIANGLEKLVELKEQGVPILVSNHSYGGPGEDPFMEDGFRLLAEADIFAAVAAGNSNQDIDQSPFVPASFTFQNMVVATANGSDGRKASFSSFGIVGTDIAAPGVGILSTTPANTYALFSGTSMAAPHVAGLALLLRQKAPQLSAVKVRDVILHPNSYDSSPLLNQNSTSARINVAKALNNLVVPSNRPPIITSTSPYALISNSHPALITVNAFDPDGDALRWTATQGAPDSLGFIKRLTEKNGMTIQTSDGAVAISGNPFAYQFSSLVRMAASDGRGGSVTTNTGFEFALDQSKRHPIAIKTWQGIANPGTNTVTWTFDVADDAKTNYLYILNINHSSGGSFGFYNITPSPIPVTTTYVPSVFLISMRAFVMDKHLNFINAAPIPLTGPLTVRSVLSVSTNEGNAPLNVTFDMSKSVGSNLIYYVYDYIGSSFGSSGPSIIPIPFNREGLFLTAAMVMNPTTRHADQVLYPIFTSRFLGVDPTPLTSILLNVQKSATVNGPWATFTNVTDTVDGPQKFYRLDIVKP